MNPASVSFARCLKHPSEFSTGFCSSCLVERLSNVHHADRGPRSQENEGDESNFASTSDFGQKTRRPRERRTLLDLFHLEDEVSIDLEREARASKIKDIAVESEIACSSITLSLESSQAAKRSPASSETSKKSGSSSFPLKLFWRKTKTTEKETSFSDTNQSNGPQNPSIATSRRNSINKAFSCPFSCAKETQQEEELPYASTSHRRSGTYLSDEIAMDGKSDKLPEEEKARRWSKMWRWSFTSHSGEVGHIRQPSLERSLSEPSHERRRTKTGEGSKSGTLPHFHGHEMGRARQSHYLSSSKKRDRERNLSKSRSAHFSSPRNVSNGLLRFYLTPMRSNRRNPSRSRSRTSYSFGHGLFGIH